MSASNLVGTEFPDPGNAIPPHHAFIAVGSNIEPEKNIRYALRILCMQVEVLGTSTFYRTRPLERPEQPDFLNGVWQITTQQPSSTIKSSLIRRIEETLGRIRSDDRHAARVIDLDLILHGEKIFDDCELSLPDPDIKKRPFLAIPLLELAPDIRLPGDDHPLSTYPVAKQFEGMEPETELSEYLHHIVRYYNDRWTNPPDGGKPRDNFREFGCDT